MRSWCWFAVRAERPADASAVASAYAPDGGPVGFVAAWPGSQRRPTGGLGIDIRAVDASGGPGWISLALARAGVRLLFDDPAVSQAMRDVLAGPWPRACSTLTLDAATIGGAVTCLWDRPRAAQSSDPFARLFPIRLLRVGPGLLGEMPPPSGPGIQRYAGSPWPWDRF